MTQQQQQQQQQSTNNNLQDINLISPNIIPSSSIRRSTHSSSSRTTSRHSSSGPHSRTLSQEPIDLPSSIIQCPSYCTLPTQPSSSSSSSLRVQEKNGLGVGGGGKSMNLEWINDMIHRHDLLDSLKQDDQSSSKAHEQQLGPTSSGIVEDRDLAIKLLLAPLVPPLGFAMVTPGIYRSGHPNYRNFSFLEGLKLTSIMYLCADNYRPHTFNWAQDRGLKIFHYRIDLSKDPNSPLTPHSIYVNGLQDILDARNHPILIHCNKGQHRVGILCALLRRFQAWDLSSVKDEWNKFFGELAPPGRNMIWSPGPAVGLGSEGLEEGSKAGKGGKGKSKIDVSQARINEWNYIEEFPMEIVHVDPNWLPAWLSP